MKARVNLFGVLFVTVASAACTYESASLSDLQCEEEGATDSERVCRGGLWVTASTDLDLPDLGIADLPAPLDLDTRDEGTPDQDAPDLSPPVDMPLPPRDMDCVPEPDEDLCGGRTCGAHSLTDNCDQTRDVQCGECVGNTFCSAITNSCEGCNPQSDDDLCQGRCGSNTFTDNCQRTRQIDCGGCDGGGVCNARGVCPDCMPESDQDFCARQQAEQSACGQITAPDNCMIERSVSCGDTCTNEQEVCDQGKCCAVPGEATLCMDVQGQCGDHVVDNRCGGMVSISCGACTPFEPDIMVPTEGGSPVDVVTMTGAPGRVNSPQLWFRPDFNFETTPERWDDASGNNRHGTTKHRVDSVARAEENNFVGMVEVDGNGKVDFDRPFTSDFTIAFVFKTNTDEPGSPQPWWDEPTLVGCERFGPVNDFGLTMEDGVLHFSHDGSDNIVVSYPPEVNPSNIPTVNDNRLHIVTVRRDLSDTTNNLEMRVDGGSLQRGHMGDRPLDACARFRIGRQTDDDGKWDGQIGDVVMYDSAQGGLNNLTVNLALKYGISLQDIDYTTPDNAIAYDVATHPQRITGIARDDDAALAKNYAISTAEGAFITLRAGADADGGAAIAQDDSYLILGDDGGSAGGLGRSITTSRGFVFDATPRTWKITNTNFDQLFTMTFDVSDIDGNIDAILIADDAAFTQNVRAYEIKDKGPDEAVTLQFTTDGTRYFTFAEAP